MHSLVEMNHPGVWVMGDLADDDRRHGMGIVIEYAGANGKPQWAENILRASRVEPLQNVVDSAAGY